MIERAYASDLREIKKLTESCALVLQERGIFQWNEHYPSLERLENDISRKELYVLKQEEKIVGIIVLSSEMDAEYKSVQWLTQNGCNIYVHRLAVLPTSWGMGYGQQLMDFAEYYAKENGFTSVRLDTFSQNERNHRFYEARGYERLGDIYYPTKSEYSFHCYEKVLP